MTEHGRILQRLIADLVTTGWGKVMVSFDETGAPDDPQLIDSLQRLVEEFELQVKMDLSQLGQMMMGFSLGPLQNMGR